MPKDSTAKTPIPSRLRSGFTSWDTYREAMNGGWGATLRLCMILIARWGLPVSATFQFAYTFFAHSR
jgi:hypothetical protein